MRRKPKENNFKAVLETIRDLMNTRCVVPDWLHDVFLGYGDPGQSTTIDEVPTINFNDTFLDIEHLRSSFPGRTFEYRSPAEKLVRPFKVGFPRDQKAPLIVEAYVPPNPGPYPQDIPKKNSVPFTHVQVEAIRSGVNSGLTMVVGPPGTGKTDVAVQIISNLYHNFPEQVRNNCCPNIVCDFTFRQYSELCLLLIPIRRSIISSKKLWSWILMKDIFYVSVTVRRCSRPQRISANGVE